METIHEDHFSFRYVESPSTSVTWLDFGDFKLGSLARRVVHHRALRNHYARSARPTSPPTILHKWLSSNCSRISNTFSSLHRTWGDYDPPPRISRTTSALHGLLNLLSSYPASSRWFFVERLIEGFFVVPPPFQISNPNMSRPVGVSVSSLASC